MEEWIQQASVVQLVDYVVNLKLEDKEYDSKMQMYPMEIADRIKESNDDCQQAVKRIFLALKCDNSKKVSQVIELIDVCSKNGNLLFHKLLATNAFSDAFLFVLKRRRGKKSVKNKLEQKAVKLRWTKTEDKLLSLIQMWSDTFIMEEDNYPGFQRVYRQLRKEAIAFPMRDPNTRMLMSNLAHNSPMFEVIDQTYGRETPSLAQQEALSKPAPKTELQKQREELESKQMQAVLQQIAREEQQAAQQEDDDESDGGDEEEDDDLELQNENGEEAFTQISQEDCEMVRSSLQILTEISVAAESLADMQQDIAKEIYQTCLLFRQRLAKNIEMQSQVGSENEVEIAQLGEQLSFLDHIDNELGSYQNQYKEMRNKANNGGQVKKEPAANSNVEQSNKKKQRRQKQAAENSDQDDNEEEKKQVENNQEEQKVVEETKPAARKLAPPPGSMRALKNLKAKLQQNNNNNNNEEVKQEVNEPQSQQQQPQESVNLLDMDNLIDLDIKGTPRQNQNQVEMNPQSNQPNSGLDYLLDLNTKLTDNNQNQNPIAPVNAQVDNLQEIFGSSNNAIQQEQKEEQKPAQTTQQPAQQTENNNANDDFFSQMANR